MRPAAKTVVGSLLQASWGFPQTLLGAGICLALGRRCRHFRFRSSLITEWPLDRGLSLGAFIFVPERCPRRLLIHEYGHAVQSLILGPLYLLVIVLPSVTWAGLPRLERRRMRRGISYYSFYTERWANALAERVCQEPSMR